MKRTHPRTSPAALLAAVLLLHSLTGCGGSDPSVEIGDYQAADAGGPLDAAQADTGGPSVQLEAGSDATLSPTADSGSGLGTCGLGSVSSAATQQQLDVFGNIVYYLDGQTLPKGRYRAQYTGGCFKVNLLFNWTVQAGTAAKDGWFLVGANTSERIIKLPGTGIVGTTEASGFPSFQDCVNANLALPPVEFEFGGGKVGVWLEDAPYIDNAVGEQGENPAWKLTLLSECPPEIILK